MNTISPIKHQHQMGSLSDTWNLKQCSICGLYQGDVYIPDRKRLTNQSRKELESRLAGLKVDYERQKLNPDYKKPLPELTFEEACKQYSREYAIPNGQTEDLYYLPYFQEQLGKNTKLRNIGPQDLKRLKADMLVKWSPATVIRRWTLLHAIFREAIRNGYLNGNPCREIDNRVLRKKAGRKNTSRLRWFTKEEMQNIYSSLLEAPTLSKYANVDNNAMTPEKREENMLFAVVARNTGLRPISIEKLEWYDLNFKDDTITARETKNSFTYVFQMSTTARKAFLRLWELKGKPQQGKVFRQANWTRIFTNLFRRLGWNDSHLPKEQRKIAPREQAVLYSFRHTYAAHLVMAGYAGKALWDAMGWENGTEEATYAHFTPKFKNAMVNAVSCDYVSPGDKLLNEARNLPSIYPAVKNDDFESA